MNRPSTALPDIGARVIADNRQNDHCTADPIFLVQEKKRVYGIDTNYEPLIEWQHGDDNTTLDATQSAIAEAFFQANYEEPEYVAGGAAYGRNDGPDGDMPEDYVGNLCRIGYREYWDFVQPFFTEESAKYYIETNGHRHRGKLQVYVDSAYRNWEWQAIRAHLVSVTKCGECDGTGEVIGPFGESMVPCPLCKPEDWATEQIP